GAAVAEEHLVEPGAPAQLGREADRGLAVERVRGVHQRRRLRRDRRDQLRVRVADRRDRDAGVEVEVALAGEVPHAAPLAARQHERRLLVVAEQRVLRERDELGLASLRHARCIPRVWPPERGQIAWIDGASYRLSRLPSLPTSTSSMRHSPPGPESVTVTGTLPCGVVRYPLILATLFSMLRPLMVSSVCWSSPG